MSGQVDDRNDTRLYDETGVEPKGFEGWMAVGYWAVGGLVMGATALLLGGCSPFGSFLGTHFF